MTDAVSPALAAGLPDAVGGALAFAGTIVLGLILLAIGTYAYKHLRGGGIEWPDEKEPDDDQLTRGTDDDEWKYY